MPSWPGHAKLGMIHALTKNAKRAMGFIEKGLQANRNRMSIHLPVNLQMGIVASSWHVSSCKARSNIVPLYELITGWQGRQPPHPSAIAQRSKGA
jgi:hypothetical protein